VTSSWSDLKLRLVRRGRLMAPFVCTKKGSLDRKK
jgi:hypothetical protein